MPYTQHRIDVTPNAQLNTISGVSSSNSLAGGSSILSADTIYYFKIQCAGTGKLLLAEMELPVGFTGNAHMGFFADNGSGTSPSGTALDTSAVVTNPVAGTVTFTFSGTLDVTTATDYWLAYQSDTAHAWTGISPTVANAQGTQARAYASGFTTANIGGTLGTAFNYAAFTVTLTTGHGNLFPTSFRYLLAAISIKPEEQAGFTFWPGFATSGDASVNYGCQIVYNSALGPGGVGSVTVDLYNGTALVSEIIFVAPDDLTNTLEQIVVSVDSQGHSAQCYLNGVAAAVSSTSWAFAGPMVTAGNYLDLVFSPRTYSLPNPQPSFCIGDGYVQTPAAFFDLSVGANIAKFWSGGAPVDLGATGTLPTGTVPIAYYTVRDAEAASAFATNRGTGGGDLFRSGGGDPILALCDVVPNGIADAWFGKTLGFVDPRLSYNRRSFITATAAPRYLGADGSVPFGAPPAMFFSRTTSAPADSFATNLGNGGTFSLSGGDLSDSASAPPCSTITTQTLVPASKGVGVTGDYRNGRLYAFNMDTLTDNGTQRRWVRSWRALEKPREETTAFRSLRVDMETGAVDNPVAGNPQVVLRWSDDGGHTFSDPRIVAVGRVGATAQSVKANRLGSTRRHARSDRIYEISSTDAFKVAIIGAEIEVG